MQSVQQEPAVEVKKTAHKLIDTLPDDTTWEKLLYTLQIRQDIEAGLADSEVGRVMSSDEVRNKLGINLKPVSSYIGSERFQHNTLGSNIEFSCGAE